jgi:hypothetical protein
MTFVEFKYILKRNSYTSGGFRGGRAGRAPP